jgi:hypothetical protein
MNKCRLASIVLAQFAAVIACEQSTATADTLVSPSDASPGAALTASPAPSRFRISGEPSPSPLPFATPQDLPVHSFALCATNAPAPATTKDSTAETNAEPASTFASKPR